MSSATTMFDSRIIARCTLVLSTCACSQLAGFEEVAGKPPQSAPSCGPQLLTNADFEEGDVGWGETRYWGDVGLANYREEPEPIILRGDDQRVVAHGATPLNGDFVACLGCVVSDYLRYTAILTQDIVLPEGARRLLLTGNILITTPATSNTDDDRIVITFVSPTHTGLLSEEWATRGGAYYLGGNSPGWAQFNVDTDELLEFPAQDGTIRLIAEGTTQVDSGFFLDELRVELACDE